jgi:ABC-type branched-subunit amino acid transport system ATPase component
MSEERTERGEGGSIGPQGGNEPAAVSAVDIPLLEARDITVTFGGLVALDAVSMAVSQHEIAGLIGPNGAGKTTLFGVLSGLLRPRAGRVLMSGDDITGSTPPARARKGMARTFQRLELFHELTVRQHVVLAHRVRHRRSNLLADLVGLGGRPGAGEDEAVDTTLELFGLSRLANVSARALPLGTGRLVEVARAVAAGPSVLLLDEPSSGLDAAETVQLSGVLRRLRDERGIALVLVEHNVEFVLGLADQVTVLDFGSVIARGNPSAIRQDPKVQAAYLGTTAA